MLMGPAAPGGLCRGTCADWVPCENGSSAADCALDEMDREAKLAALAALHSKVQRFRRHVELARTERPRLFRALCKHFTELLYSRQQGDEVSGLSQAGQCMPAGNLSMRPGLWSRSRLARHGCKAQGSQRSGLGRAAFLATGC